MQKTAVVVGGASGVGRGIAQSLSRRQFKLVVADRNPPEGITCDYIALDATDDGSVDRFREVVSSLIPHIDALAITVGAIDQGAVVGVPTDRWRWMIDANLMATVRVVDALLPMLSKGSTLLLTGSGSGLLTPEADAGLGLYSVAKHALTGYFRALRGEAARTNIDVCLLLPTAIRGRLAENSAQDRAKTLSEAFEPHRGQQPANRVLHDPEDVGDDFVRRWLNGQSVISNEADTLVLALQEECDTLKNQLKR